MAKRANPTLIGAFVLGGLALVVAAVLLLGGREWFKRPVTCVMAFDGSVAGLTVGSPVSFRGVQLGTVTGIQIRAGTPYIIVLAQIDPARVQGLPGIVAERGFKATIDDYIAKQGLRAQLQVLSLLTGQLYVALDTYPSIPARMTGVGKGGCEIPTIPTTLAQFQEQLKKAIAAVEQLPIKEVVESAARTLDGIDQIVRGPELRHAIKSLDDTLSEAQGFFRNVNPRIDPTLRAFQATLEQAQRTIDEVGRDVRKLVDNVDGQVKPLAGNLESTLDSARALIQDAQRSLHAIDVELGPALSSVQGAGDAARDALRKAETALDHVDGVLDGKSPLGYQLAEALSELARAARTLRAVGEEIDRQPNVLLFGRGGSDAR
jgi:paraquat-inducible protein B